MSIYSGFATRSQEQYYDKILYNLLSTLLLRLTKFYRREPVDDPAFLRIVFDQERTLRKMEKRKYLDPKYSELLTAFKGQVTREEPEAEERRERKIDREDERPPRPSEDHELNRTLSLLGREFGELRARADRLQGDDEQEGSLAKIEERKKHHSKKKRKQKKGSIRSNLDIWEVRQQRPPQLPSLHPLHTMQRTVMSKTKFNNFSERQRSKQLEDLPPDDEPDSLKNVLSKPPKFRAKMYFK